MQPMTPLREMIRKRGLTDEQALKASGLSRHTFEILLGGGVTLPQLALKIGKGLKLTQEETRQLGKHLDKASWDAKKLPYKAIDVDPNWYKKGRSKATEEYELWLNKEGLLQVLLERKIDQRDFYAAHPELKNMNYSPSEKRREVIGKIAEELGVPRARLEAAKPQMGHVEPMYRIRGQALEALLKSKGMTKLQLAKAMWTPGENDRTPARRMNRLCQQIRACEPVSQLRAEAIAKVLGVEVCEIAEITIRIRKS